DADRDQLLVCQHRTGADRRHPAMDGVESMRRAEEIGRALAGASDARELDHLLRIDAHLEERVDDALGDRVMAAAGAQRGLAAFVSDVLEPDSIQFAGHRYSPPVMPLRPASATRTSFFATSNPSCASRSSVTLRASIGRPL